MENRKNFFRVFGFIRPYALAYCVGIFIYNVQGFAFPLVNGLFLGRVTEGILQKNFPIVTDAVLFLLIAFGAIGLMLAFGVYAYVIAAEYVKKDFKLQVFKSYLKSSVEGEKHSGEGIAAVNTDSDTALMLIGESTSQVLRCFITITFSLVAIFIIDWRMGFGALAVCLISYFLQVAFSRPLARIGKAKLEANAEAVKSISNIFAGALAIRVFSRQKRALIQFDQESGKLRKLDFKRALIDSGMVLFLTVQGWLTIALVFGFGSYLVAAHGFSFATLMIIFPIAQTIGESASFIGEAYAGLMPPLEASKRCFAIIDAGTTRVQTEKRPEWNGKYDINIKSLNFKYKNSEKGALSDINLTIKENAMVAFVGASGSGKSTLLRAIIGMYEREDLGLKLGDLPFNVNNIKDWRAHFAYVDQSCKLFDMTIKENIEISGGLGDAQEAAKSAFAHDFIIELADGYETNCGEKGASLSGGQKQRIAIARALYKKAPVLIFDEATSALDSESERAIMETIETLRGKRTILITTHNLHNIENADVIVTMEEGRIVEMGSHDELVKLNGKYKALLK